MDPETFAHSKLILLWGTNTLTSGHHLWKFILAAQKHGAHVVAIDPLRTRTADAGATSTSRRCPGTDAALALGLLQVVLDMGAEDREYLARAHARLGGVPERILEFPPDRVGRDHRPGRGADRRARARGSRTTRPTGIRATMGMQRHAGGGTALRTLYALPGVTGDWQYPGGGASYSHQRLLRAPTREALCRDDLLEQPGPHAER